MVQRKDKNKEDKDNKEDNKEDEVVVWSSFFVGGGVSVGVLVKM